MGLLSLGEGRQQDLSWIDETSSASASDKNSAEMSKWNKDKFISILLHKNIHIQNFLFLV